MGWAIICDARKGKNLGIETLALVDRSRSSRLWWTSDDEALILNYQKKSAADFACKRLKRNNAEVVPYEQARAIIAAQENEILGG